MYRGWRVSVVIPAHNEARLLPRTLEGLPGFVDHVLVIDDASSDRTGAVARRHGGSRVEIIRHRYNQGVGGAIVTGYRRAIALGADAAVVVGADAQMDPTEMGSLLDGLVEGGADYVKGDRLGHPQVRATMPRVRYLGNWALTALTRLASGQWALRDAQCGYTAIRADVLQQLPLEALYRRYGFPNDLIIRLAELGARIVDAPVTPIYDDETSGLRVHRVVLPILWLLLRSGLRHRLRRLRRVSTEPSLLASE